MKKGDKLICKKDNYVKGWVKNYHSDLEIGKEYIVYEIVGNVIIVKDENNMKYSFLKEESVSDYGYIHDYFNIKEDDEKKDEFELFDDFEWEDVDDTYLDDWKEVKSVLLKETLNIIKKDKNSKLISDNKKIGMEQVYAEIYKETDLGIKLIESGIKLKKLNEKRKNS